MRPEKRVKIKERRAAALESKDALGHFLLLVDDCPVSIIEAWRRLSDFVENYKID